MKQSPMPNNSPSYTVNQHRKPPSWAIISAAVAFQFVGVGYTNTFGVFQEYYQSKRLLNKPSSEIILIGSTASSLYMILGAFTGRFVDMFRPHRAAILGCAFMIGSLFGASFATNFFQLLLSQGIGFGLGVSFAYYPSITVARRHVSSQRYGLVNGIIVSGGALGGLVLPYIVRVLLERTGLAGTFRILGYISIAILTPSMVVLWLDDTKIRSHQTGSLFDLALLGNSRFRILLFSGTIAMTGFLPRYFLISPSAIYKGVSPNYAAWLLGMMNGLSIIGRISIGMYADRFGKSNALATSFILCGLGHLMFWLPSVIISSEPGSIALFSLFVVFVGLFGSGFVSLVPVVVGDLFGSEGLASRVGLLNSIMGLGVMAGPSAAVAIVNTTGDYTWGVLFSGMLMVLGGVSMAAAFRYS